MTSKCYEIEKNLYLVTQEIPKSSTPAPPLEIPTNHIAVIDCSGSMYSELPKIREQLKKRLPKLLKEDDTFSIIWFSGRGEYGVLLEAEPVASLKELREVENAIDRWLRPQGLTGFKEPLEEAEKLVKKISKKNGNSFSLMFMSDGYDNQWDKISIIKAVEKVAGVVQSAAFIEYGYYADRQLLTKMAEKAGGQLIFAQDFDSYSPSFESIVQKRPVGGPRIEMDIVGDAIRGFVWAMDGGDLITYAIENGKVRVPETTERVWYISPSIKSSPVKLDDAATSAMYAALSLFSVRMAPEIILPLLKVTGDVAFIEKFGGLFGKQKYSEFMDEAKSAAFDSKLRLTKGFDPKKVPSEDAFTVLEFLQLLDSDEDNKVLLDHEKFKYSRISRGRVDSDALLTPEEEEKVKVLSAELTKTKDAKKVKEITAQIAAISNKPEPLKFVQNKSEDGYSVSSLTFNESTPNVSFLVKKTGTVDISKRIPSSLEKVLPHNFETFIFRNYAVIKDGLVNIDVLPVKLSESTLENLFKANKEGRLSDEVVTSENGVTFINLKMLPVINRKMVQAISANTLFRDEWELTKVQASQKVFKSVLKELAGTKKSEGFVEKYGQEAADFLKDNGFTDYSGFSPKSRIAESTDVYLAKEMDVAIAGYSSIPSLNDFKKQIVKGKYTPSASLMKPAWDEIEEFRKNESNPNKLEKWLNKKIKDLDFSRRNYLRNKSQQIFSVIVGQTWFKEFGSIDENSMSLSIDSVDLNFSIKMREVEIKC